VQQGETMETTITVRLPKPVYRRLNQQAKIFNRPLDDIVVQTIKRSLPLWHDTIPPDFEKELAQMNALSLAQLQKIAKSKLPADQQRKLDRLLEKNSEGTITVNELAVLDAVQFEANSLMLRKAKALALLHRMGFPLPLPNRKRNKST